MNLELQTSTIRMIKETAAKIRDGEEAEISAGGLVLYLDVLIATIESRQIAEAKP